MELLEELKQQYGWQKAVAVNEQMIETDHGMKRVRHWQDQQLMNWHTSWRDDCSAAPIVITDRMIRTLDGEASVPWKSSWITVHDDIPDPFMQDENGQVWGHLIGLMIQSGQRDIQSMETHRTDPPDPVKLEKSLWKFPTAFQPTLRHIVHEGKARLQKAASLQKRHAQSPLPILDSMQGINRAKDIHGILHWNGTDHYPEQGYYSVCMFLKDWLKRHDQIELSTVLDQIAQTYPSFSVDQGGLLLAECLVPHELHPLIELEPNQQSYEDIETAIESCKVEWAISKRMVEELAEWLDGGHT